MDGIVVERSTGAPVPARPQTPSTPPPSSEGQGPRPKPKAVKETSAPQKDAAATSAARQRNLENLKAEVAELSKSQSRTDVTVELDPENANEPIVIVTDRTTGQILKEFPPEELRKMKALLSDLGGLIVDREA